QPEVIGMASLLSKTDVLGSLVGRRIDGVRRYLFRDDYNFYDPQNRDQEADGPTEVRTDDGLVFTIVGNTEEMAIEMIQGPVQGIGSSYDCHEVSSNEFWSPRVHKTIVAIDVLQSIHEASEAKSAFGIEVFLDHAESFVIEYLSDEEHVDQTRVTGPYAGPLCRRIRIAGLLSPELAG
ncbi:MAG: hypothetical protein KJZ78_12810, partial [Bryobacteraceae bacterium]|nr:hypothetical protein [Bryobacteraceae bacterium]